MENALKAIDFFCGAGGLTKGLLDVGIDVLAGVDSDLRLAKTYSDNNKPSKFIPKLIEDIDIHDLRRDLGINGTDIVLYTACTPCQPFSTLNRMSGVDERKNLLLRFGEKVRDAPPDLILVENVPGLNTAYGREIYEQFIETIASVGFNAPFSECLDARNYGVPQVRKRFILLAARNSNIHAIEKVANPPNVRDYIGKYPPLTDGDVSYAFPNHVTRPLKPHLRRIIQAVPKNGGSRGDVEDISILLKCHQKNPKVHKDVFGRMKWDGAAPTLTRRCVDVYCGRFAHPDQDRGISLREAAALQTFPDDYQFSGTFHHIAAQIGNAVPVAFARHLGATLLEAAEG